MEDDAQSRPKVCRFSMVDVTSVVVCIVVHLMDENSVLGIEGVDDVIHAVDY